MTVNTGFQAYAWKINIPVGACATGYASVYEVSVGFAVVSCFPVSQGLDVQGAECNGNEQSFELHSGRKQDAVIGV